LDVNTEPVKRRLIVLICVGWLPTLLGYVAKLSSI